MTDDEMIALVYELNGCLPNALAEEFCNGFNFASNGYASCILFGDILMYDEDNDERPLDDDNDDFEMTVKEWVISEYNKLMQLMSEANFTGEEQND